MLSTIASVTVAAAESTSDSGGSFLVKPGIGLMIWTLVVFLVAMVLLSRLAFPRIVDALDKRQRMIEDSIDTAERTKQEADQLLAEYRERLTEARHQADEIVARAKKAADVHEREAKEASKEARDEMLEQTRRAIQEIRKEVADLTVRATEKVTRKSLDEGDQRRLVEEALNELDFSALSGESRN